MMITDYFKPAPRPLASPVRSAVKQPMQKRPVEDNSSIVVAISACQQSDSMVWYGRCDFCVTEITPNYNATP